MSGVARAWRSRGARHRAAPVRASRVAVGRLSRVVIGRSRVAVGRFVAMGSLVALAAVAAIIGAAAFPGAQALLTASATGTSAVFAGMSAELAWADESGVGQELNMNIGPLHPGESVERVATLSNNGSISLSKLQLEIAGTGTGTPSDGLQLAIDRCSVPWVSRPDSAGDLFYCSGMTTSVSPDRPLQARITLHESPASAPLGRDYLLLRFRLPESAPGSVQGTAGTVRLLATGSN